MIFYHIKHNFVNILFNKIVKAGNGRNIMILLNGKLCCGVCGKKMKCGERAVVDGINKLLL